MTFAILIFVALLGLSLAGGYYFRRKEAGIVESGPVWDRLIGNVNKLVTDPTVPDKIAKDVTVFAAIAGCGCVVAALLRDVVFHDISKEYIKEGAAAEVRELTAGQKLLLQHILYDLLLIDSLQMPLLGLLFRKMLGQTLKVAIDDGHRAEIQAIQSVMFTAHHVAQKRLAQHKVPNKALVAMMAAP